MLLLEIISWKKFFDRIWYSIYLPSNNFLEAAKDSFFKKRGFYLNWNLFVKAEHFLIGLLLEVNFLISKIMKFLQLNNIKIMYPIERNSFITKFSVRNCALKFCIAAEKKIIMHFIKVFLKVFLIVITHSIQNSWWFLLL